MKLHIFLNITFCSKSYRHSKTQLDAAKTQRVANKAPPPDPLPRKQEPSRTLCYTFGKRTKQVGSLVPIFAAIPTPLTAEGMGVSAEPNIAETWLVNTLFATCWISLLRNSCEWRDRVLQVLVQANLNQTAKIASYGLQPSSARACALLLVGGSNSKRQGRHGCLCRHKANPWKQPNPRFWTSCGVISWRHRWNFAVLPLRSQVAQRVTRVERHGPSEAAFSCG